MSTTQISDFFGFYPEIDYWMPTNESEFNKLISRKQEFLELRPGLTEATPARGEGFLTQKTAVRFITWYDRLLLMHEPGTGKSCIIAHSAELFKNEYMKNPDDPTKINRAIILVNGPTLVENIKNEIVCRCTDRIYETQLVMNSVNETVMKGNITRELNTWYDIMTYHAFVTTVNKYNREEDLERFMSNKVIYIDEAHNVPTLSDIKEQGRKEMSDYNTILRAFHVGKRNKIVLATATPMINSPVDIVPLMNLILPPDFQMEYTSPSDQDQEEFANRGLDYFEPYFRGRVSYVRSLKTGADKKFIGDTIDGRQTPIFFCQMSAFQYLVYSEISRRGRETTDFYINERQASNFVFPDGSYGSSGFNKYVESRRDVYSFRTSTPETRQFKENVGNGEYLSMYSQKFVEMITLCLDRYPGTEVKEDEHGIVYVFFPDFTEGSGAILFGLCLQEYGYEEFRETTSVFIETTGSSRPVPCPTPTQIVERQTRRGFTKRKRFAILSNKTPDVSRPIILSTLNSYENRYGEYIQVLIGTRITREGINIFNSVGMIKASSGWNLMTNYQAEERIFRSTSHDLRIAEKRKRLQEEGIPTDDITFDVFVANMASIYVYDEEQLERELELNPVLAQRYQDSPEVRELLSKSNANLIDPLIYVRSEEKDQLVRKVLTLLKRSAFDCFINYPRNVRDTDRAEDRYICAGNPTGEPVDWTTKIMFYSSEEVEYVQFALLNLFSRFHSLKIDQVVDIITRENPKIRPVFIEMAIEETISRGSRFVDRKGREWRFLDRMGYNAFLKESSEGVLYLERDKFVTSPLPENTAYNSALIGTQNKHNNSFLDYVTEEKTLSEMPVIQELIKSVPGSDEFYRILNTLSITNQVALLEQAIYERETKGITTDFYENIISAFNHTIFTMKEPVDLIAKVKKQLDNRGKTRGRKPNPNTQPRLKNLELGSTVTVADYDPANSGEKIYLQNLSNQESHAQANYSLINRYLNADGKIRLLKLSENQGWRNVTDAEYLVYKDLIRRQIKEMRDYYEQFPIYGIMLPPQNILHLRNKSKEMSEAETDARFRFEGKKCVFWNKNELIDMVYQLDIDLPGFADRPSNQQMLSILGVRNGTQYESDRHIYTFYYIQHVKNLNRESICELIENRLRATDKIFTGKRPPRKGIGTSGGSIRVGADLTYPDYSEPFTTGAVVSSVIPDVPTQAAPQFAASVGQSALNYTTGSTSPDFSGSPIPQSRAEVSSPPPDL